jgi:hypothetical protein
MAASPPGLLAFAAPVHGAAGKDVPAMASPTITDRPGDDRRGFLRKSSLAGATAGSAGLLLGGGPALAKRGGDAKLGVPTAGDIAILKFLSAAEQLEDDLWQQHDELIAGETAAVGLENGSRLAAAWQSPDASWAHA